MSSIAELQRLGLISKVCAELDNHLGFSDKTLAEFIIHLATIPANAKDPKAFQKALADNGAEFPDSFAQNLHRIINRISGGEEETKNQTSSKPANRGGPFAGLSIQNSAPVPLMDMVEEQTSSLFDLDKSNTATSSEKKSSDKEKEDEIVKTKKSSSSSILSSSSSSSAAPAGRGRGAVLPSWMVAEDEASSKDRDSERRGGRERDRDRDNDSGRESGGYSVCS